MKSPKRPKGERRPIAREMKITVESIELDRLKPHPRNPRHHPEPGTPEWNALRESLRHDYYDPLVWNKRNGFLVSGHLRAAIASHDGVERIDCVVVDYDEATHVARMISANRHAGSFDDEQVMALLGELKDLESNLAGFTDEQLIDVIGHTRAEQDPEGKLPDSIYELAIVCQSEPHQKQLYNRFTEEGLKCKVVTF